MPDLVSVANDLKLMPDQWLAQQAQSPSADAPPYLVLAEIQRRQKLRSGASHAQEPQSSVSQDLIKSMFARMPPTQGLIPQASAPPGMAPVSQQQNTAGLGPGGFTAPGSMKTPRTMAEGGEYDEYDDSEPVDDTGYTAQGQLDPAEAASAAPVGSASRMAVDPISGLIDTASQKYQLPPHILHNLVQNESNFNPRAMSSKGAMGLTQLMPDTARFVGVSNPYDPAQNVDGGARYLRWLIDRRGGNIGQALIDYNRGPYAKGQPTQGTLDYAKRILGGNVGGVAQPNVAPVAPAPVAGTAVAANAAPTASAAPPAAAPPSTEPVTLTMPKPEPPAELTDAQKRLDERNQALTTLLQNHTVYNPNSAMSPENVRAIKDTIQTFLGPEPDNTKWQQSLAVLQAQANELMHPKLSSMLIQFGTNLMASRAHRLSWAMGEAGAATAEHFDQQEQQGRQLFLQAMKTGIELQDRTNVYHEKVGQLALQTVRAQQAAGTAGEKTFQQQVLQAQREKDAAQKDVAKAQTDWDKTLAASPYGRLAQVNATRQAMGEPQLTSANAKPGEMPYVEFGTKPTGATGTKAPTMQDQYLEAAIRQTAQTHGITLPANQPVTLQNLPLEFQREAVNLNAQYGAQRTVAGQEGVADLVTPEAIDMMASRIIQGQPMTSRNPILVAKAYDRASVLAKQMGMTNMQIYLEQNAAKANQGALNQLTKNIETIEPFIKMADYNAGIVEQTIPKVANLGAPVWNTPIRNLESQFRGDPNVAAFRAALLTAQTELSRVLSSASGSGVLSDTARDEIKPALNEGATPQQIKAALDVFRNETTNRRQTYRAQQQDLMGRTAVGTTGASGATPDANTPPPPTQTKKPGAGRTITMPQLQQYMKDKKLTDLEAAKKYWTDQGVRVVP